MKLRNFDDLMDFIEEVTDVVAEKAETFVENSSEKLSLGKEIVGDAFKSEEAKKNLAAAYAELGEKAYDYYSEGYSAFADRFSDEFRAISDARDEVEMIAEKVRAWKGVKVCEDCGTEVPQDTKFCPECGIAFYDDDAEDELCCPKCRADIEPGQRFCKECGHRLS